MEGVKHLGLLEFHAYAAQEHAPYLVSNKKVWVMVLGRLLVVMVLGRFPTRSPPEVVYDPLLTK
ncbi:MAG TPA: hypothetical protein VJJ80_03870 [Patescibacteria group bacterium]|nr:hypothetical protein [Patescibacteria group bacterium]